MFVFVFFRKNDEGMEKRKNYRKNDEKELIFGKMSKNGDKCRHVGPK